MPQATVSFGTVGCRLNQYETDAMKQAFLQGGYSVVSFEEPATVCVINTCTVTGRSDYRSRQLARRARRRNPDATVVITGCYAQNQPEASASIPEVDLVVGNADKLRLPDLLKRAGGDRIVAVRPLPSTFEDAPVSGIQLGGRTRVFLKIQDGCDLSCAYCAVRMARGQSRSRAWASIAREAQTAVTAGYQEIVLTGVNLGSYGRDLGNGATLATILRNLASLPGIGRVRLSSVEPQEVTDELLDLVESHSKVCAHLHLPLQSGSQEVLRRMKRNYDSEEYASLVHRISRRKPDCGIGADVMVGFPGETEDDFAQTIHLVESLPLTYLHVFAYSPRPGTEAAVMKPPVPAETKKARSAEMRALGAVLARRFQERLVGRTLPVLFERNSHEDGLSGLSHNYARVRCRGGGNLVNHLHAVKITGVNADGLVGELPNPLFSPGVVARCRSCL